MHSMKQAALCIKEALLRGRITEVLEILRNSCQAKKRAGYGISNSHIDQVAAEDHHSSTCLLGLGIRVVFYPKRHT